jgi:gamma-glutamyltranspeptidase/glutathione hydrolase
MSSTNTIRHSVAATPFPESGAAARRAFERGGNAFDAAAAATLTLCVVSPGSVGIAGYGGSMVALANGKGIVALDYDSRAPRAYRDELFFGKDENLAKRGYLSVSVPGVLAGIARVIKHYGKITFRDAVEPAIEVAERGHTMDERHHGLLQEWAKWTDPASRKALFPTGDIPATGATWKQPDFARLLRRLADEGPDAFYHGEIPRQIVRQIHDHGGILSEEDFASYKPTEVQPDSASYRGVQFYTPPAPSGGLTTLQILKALEHFDVKTMEPWGAKFVHVLAEVTKACWQDRERYFGDPDAVKIPREKLLSEEHIAAIVNSVGDTARGYPPPGLPKESDHTVNVLTADTDGNVVSMTSTQGEMLGSGVAIEGLGMLVGHGMSRFTYERGHPNAPAPGKRMFHNMSPLVGLRGGKPRVVVGMPGGPKIVNVSAQIAVNLLDFGRSPADAIKHPRLHTQGSEPITVSPDVPDKTVGELEKMGHKIEKLAAMGGPANAMIIDEAGNVTAANEYGPKGMVQM